MTLDDPEKPKRWGAALPPRGERIARLLNTISNVTILLPERKDAAEELATLLPLTPHQAWRLACDTRIALGFGPNGTAAWHMIVQHQPPNGRWPSAEEWLRAAHLDTEGRDDTTDA